MDIKEQFEEFIKTEEFIFDEKEVAIKTFNFMQAEITRLTALVESYKVDAERWQDLTDFGQISVGDKLKFTTSGKLVEMKAEEILYAGNHLEEVIYDSKNNYYFLTSMAVKNMSHAKNVKFSKAIDAAMKGKG